MMNIGQQNRVRCGENHAFFLIGHIAIDQSGLPFFLQCGDMVKQGMFQINLSGA
jgi:hypothetical protein